jgi:hypothetical protein
VAGIWLEKCRLKGPVGLVSVGSSGSFAALRMTAKTSNGGGKRTSNGKGRRTSNGKSKRTGNGEGKRTSNGEGKRTSNGEGKRTSNRKGNSRFLRCDAHGETVSIFGRNDGIG